MTEPYNPRRDRYEVTDPSGQSVFQIGFPLDDVDYITVYINGVALAPAGYTVDLDDLEVTLDAEAEEGSIVTLEGSRVIERTIDYPLRGDLRSKKLNGDADAVIQMLQEMRRDLDRVLQLNKAAGNDVSTILPLPVANKGLKWNDAGDALINTDDSVDGVLSAAQEFADAAEASQIAAAASEENTAEDAALAALSAARLYGSSATSVLIATGSKSFTTQADKIFAGQQVLVSSAANTANFMHGNVTSYDAVTGALVLNVVTIGGTGTFSDWIVAVSGVRGPQGAQGNTGPAGSGSGDMLRSNNLSDLITPATARTNLGLGTIATQNSNGVTISGGTITGITDIAVADGGTGASNAATARANLGLGNVQNVDTTNASNITTGTLDIARVASGTPDGTKFVADDGTLKVPPTSPFTGASTPAVGDIRLMQPVSSTVNANATTNAATNNLKTAYFSGSTVSFAAGNISSGTYRNITGVSISTSETGLFQRVS